MPTGATLNGTRTISVRLLTPSVGVWIAECDLDPDDLSTVPTGAATLIIGGATLQGTVDPSRGGRFGGAVRVRVVGGANGWSSFPAPQAFQNDSGLTTTDVIGPVADGVGETLSDPSPSALGSGPIFVSGGLPAMAVFGDLQWWVDPAGVTQVGPRPLAQPDSTLEILGYDAEERRLEVSCDALVLPGTQLTDTAKRPRWDGTLTLGDVEQTFTREGSRATVMVLPPNVTQPYSRLMTAMTNLVRVASGRAFLRLYQYRFVSADTPTRLNVQAVDPAPGQPDAMRVPMYPGMAGLGAKLAPAQIVLVGFLQDGFKSPVIVAYDTNTPLEATVDASQTVHIGPSAAGVELGGDGGAPVAGVGDICQIVLPPLCPFTGSLNGVPFTGFVTFAQPAIGYIQTGSSKVRRKS